MRLTTWMRRAWAEDMQTTIRRTSPGEIDTGWERDLIITIAIPSESHDEGCLVEKALEKVQELRDAFGQGTGDIDVTVSVAPASA